MLKTIMPLSQVALHVGVILDLHAGLTVPVHILCCREDDAATALVCNAAFLRKVRTMCGTTSAPSRGQGIATRVDAVLVPSNAMVGAVWSVPHIQLSDDVFVGSFRGEPVNSQDGTFWNQQTSMCGQALIHKPSRTNGCLLTT